MQFAGGGAKTLRFVLGSVHEDVRREVLTEVMAQFDQSWSAGLAATGTLLVDLFDDPAPKLRQEAFAFAVKKTKGKDQGPLQAGLRSRYSDVRFETVRTLIQRGTKAAQAMLVQAVEDDDMDVRQAALQALVSADAEDVLIKVLESNHLDARLKAAAARARHGDQRTLDPLLVLAAQAEPDDKVRRKAWVAVVAAALNALAELGDPAAMDRVVPLLQSKHAEIRKAAANALVWISRPDSADALRAALQHDDPEVKYRAALGLALCRNPLGASILFSDQARGLLPVEDQLTAAFVLGELGEDRVVTFLDDDSEAPRNVATTLLLLREMVAHDGSPQRCLACLSSRVPQVRLTAAAALESFADPGAS
ncbi:MAG: HEAT repeat domain-containing protein, partial [Planctomycetales bacterium]